MRLTAAWLGLACCGWLAAQTAEQLPKTAAALQRLAGAFRSGNPEPLRELASQRARVHVDLEGAGQIRGAYGAGQLVAVFARVFAECETRSFEFLPEAQSSSGPSAFARARWVRRARAEQRDLEQTLTFVLALEDGAWRLVEIRASR